MPAGDHSTVTSGQSLDRSATERTRRRSRAARAALAAGGMASLAAVLLGPAAPTVVAAARADGPSSYASPWTTAGEDVALGARPDTVGEQR